MSEIRDKIHELFGVKEPHELPAAMMEVINDSTKLSVICSNYKKMFPNTKHDYLRDYFQENQADRSNLMQDYTPESICQILDRFPVRYFADMNIQKYISAEQYLYETEMQYEHDQIEMLEHFKKYLFQVMFC